MQNKQKSIEHKGRILSITDNHIQVQVLAISACASCHAKGLCSISDVKEKIIDVYANTDLFQVGEDVQVVLKQSLGYKALMLGYVFPFFLVLAILLLVFETTQKEGLAGLAALGILVPYYVLLYLSRNKLHKEFHFFIQKIG